ncbi:MAG: efflux RND transporter periplasmic adaptor subunit [Acidobacteria bacterium]|nr:efflux RND transporter periplasmic adaptor subunit [Acidobacteriota bacterium]
MTTTETRPHYDQEYGTHSQYQEPEKKSHLFLILVLVVLALLAVGGITLLSRRTQYKALANETEKMAVPSVQVIHPTPEPGQEDLVLPSTTQAYVDSPIYARTNGYLLRWYHDIGTRVKKGDLLADIDTPEVDQQLVQARADLGTSKANEDLSKITATRYQELIKTDGVSKQEVDNAVGDYAAKKATTAASEANVRRLEELESFKHIYAPFSGVITQRNVDPGNLINAGNGGAGQSLFNLAQTDPIRAYVRVPEIYAPAIRAGLGASLELVQYPGRHFEGKVVRTADAIDLASRTLNTEVDVPNKSGELLPGGYAQVHLAVKATGEHLVVPVNALLFRAEGLRVVVVDENHKTHLQQMTIGRDYGTTLEVLQGLKSTDWIVLNPADSLEDGMQVNVKQVKAAQQQGGAAPGQGGSPSSSGTHPNGNGQTGAPSGNNPSGSKN